MLAASVSLAAKYVAAPRPFATPNEQWPAPGTPLEPVGYSPVWLIIGCALLALVLGYFVLVALFTRRRIREPKPTPPPPPVDVDALRAESLTRIDELELRARRREIGQRAATEEISGLVRDYVAALTGIPADRMTLADLQRSPLPATADAVARFYPAVFSHTPPHNFDASLRAARQVLAGCP